MRTFKFFRGYIGTIGVFDGQTFATASIARPDNPWWTNEEVERARLQNHFERARLLAQNETDRIERERVRIQAEIRSRLGRYEMTNSEIERGRLEMEGRIDAVSLLTNELRNNLNKPFLWTRFKDKLESIWFNHKSDIVFWGIATPLLGLFGWAIYQLHLHVNNIPH